MDSSLEDGKEEKKINRASQLLLELKDHAWSLHKRIVSLPEEDKTLLNYQRFWGTDRKRLRSTIFMFIMAVNRINDGIAPPEPKASTHAANALKP